MAEFNINNSKVGQLNNSGDNIQYTPAPERTTALDCGNGERDNPPALSGPEFCILNAMLGYSGFHIEGDHRGGFRVDIQRYISLPSEIVARAIQSLVDKGYFTSRDDGAVFFSKAQVTPVYKEVLDHYDRGLLREMLTMLAEHYEKPGQMILVDGINSVLDVDDNNAYTLYVALRDKGLITTAKRNNIHGGASYGVYVKPETKRMVDKWNAKQPTQLAAPQAHPGKTEDRGNRVTLIGHVDNLTTMGDVIAEKVHVQTGGSLEKQEDKKPLHKTKMWIVAIGAIVVTIAGVGVKLFKDWKEVHESNPTPPSSQTAASAGTKVPTTGTAATQATRGNAP